MTILKFAHLLFIISIIIVALIFGQGLMIPFIMGMLLWFVDRKLKLALNKISIVKKYFPNWLKVVSAAAILLTTLAIVIEILSANIQTLASSLTEYQDNTSHLIEQINGWLNIDVIESAKGYVGNFDFKNLLSALLSSLSGLFSNAFMIVLYALFIVLEETYFDHKMAVIFNNKNELKKAQQTLGKIEKSISSYFGLKTLVSLVTGGLSFIVLFFIGVEAPVFWAFLIFILNFIPTIGSLIATFFPAIFALFQFGELTAPLIILIVVGLIQIIVGNYLEPRIMGSSMNISPLVTIIALSFWGVIWGITGMILSVPITVVMIIIFSQFKKTRSVAVMLSEKGELGNLTN